MSYDPLRDEDINKMGYGSTPLLDHPVMVELAYRAAIYHLTRIGRLQKKVDREVRGCE